MGGLTGPNVHACVLNVNTPDLRGTAYAVYTLSDDLGKGIGPWLVAVLIKAFGRETAFNLGISLGFFFCGLFLLLQFFTLERDERRVADAIEGRLGERFLETREGASPEERRRAFAIFCDRLGEVERGKPEGLDL